MHTTRVPLKVPEVAAAVEKLGVAAGLGLPRAVPGEPLKVGSGGGAEASAGLSH